MAYITKEYLENNIKNYDQYRKLDKEGQANGLATLDANGKLVSTQIPAAAKTTYNGSPVTSIVAGSNTAMSLTNGALTIASTAAGNGNVPAYTSADASKVLIVNSAGTACEWNSVPAATDNSLGGVKAGSPLAPTTGTVSGRSQTINGIPTMGKYYAIEIVSDGDLEGHAVLKIPSVESAFYSNSDENQISLTFDNNTSDSFTLTLSFPNNTSNSKQTVLYAELEYIDSNNNMKAIKMSNMSIDIPASLFNITSIKAGNPAYACLRFTTKTKKISGITVIQGHTYNATIQITYKNGAYNSDIIV